MNLQSFAQRIPDSHPRVEGGVRILEDHLETAALFAKLFSFEGTDFNPIEDNLTSVRIIQAHNSPSQGRLAAARFPYQSQSFTFRDGKTNVIYRFEGLDRLSSNSV